MDQFITSLSGNLLLAGGALVLLLLLSGLPGPLRRLAGHVVTNCLAGGACLVAINLLAMWSGVMLPLNGVTAVTGAVLGAPGVCALAALSALGV